MHATTLLARAYDLAARCHRDQKRKDGHTPYINHPIQVAAILATTVGVTDAEVLAAAVLHDVVEDTETTLADLEAAFGARVAALVAECTDDKPLPKSERKRLQIVHAPHKSADAKLIKLADKTTNVTDVVGTDWPVERKREYLDWAERVAAGLRGANAGLDEAFDRALAGARSRLG